MVHSFLASPFSDTARAAQYAVVLAALQADPAHPDSLLLGNLVLEDGAAPLDAVVVRPHSLTLLVLVPRGGRLSIPALGYGSWQLGGLPLPGAQGEFDNPYEQLVQQKAALEAWLRPRFGPAQANLQCIGGLVLFAAPVALAPDVEPALRSPAAVALGLQLLSDPAALPRHLEARTTSEINLSAQDLADWAAELAAFAAAEQAEADGETSAPVAGPPRPSAAAASVEPSAPGFLGQKAKALWGWLGAVDVPDDDPAYGYDPSTVAARSEEKQHLEQLRQQMQADVAAQLQALETREAERERSIAQLRAELAQAPPVAAEATALVSRLGAETREKAALEAEMQASRAESAARNQELDAKIQQLGQLIEQLSTAPAVVPAPVAAPVPVAGPAAPAQPVAPLPAPAISAPLAAIAPPPALPKPVAPTAAPTAAASAAAPSPNSAAAPFAANFQAIRKRVQDAVAGLIPRMQQAQPGGALKSRAVLAAAGVAVLGLGVWGLSHLGGSPPVPYQENGRWGYADASGKPLVPAQYTAASPFEKGQAVVAKNGAYGLVDEDGKEVVPPAYDALNPYAGDYARVRVGDAYTFLDQDGQEFDHYYFNALDFAEGQAAVLDHRGWHYINGPTEPDTPPAIFVEAYSFADGLARVKLPDGYTYITPDYLADPSRGTKPFGRYELAADFVDGKAQVTQGGRRFAIDKDGGEVK